ncbi:hypothetical protein [Halochromatium glycolicum]|uniref:hypothetical protein n=1 Tax=Halochromatium glycolicum TaxID=85075 RepID=UPI001A910B99|nr:hypothetical protein [Halochromatium glycolicum]
MQSGLGVRIPSYAPGEVVKTSLSSQSSNRLLTLPDGSMKRIHWRETLRRMPGT